MVLNDKIRNELSTLCKLHKVGSLYLIGSAVGANFHKNSDVDFLIKFENIALSDYFNNYFTLKEKLEELFKRKVDLVEEQTLKNPILIQSINSSKELVYG
ncbi:MAG: nucleotidyltransferase family protein [Flavobacterium sp.]